VTLTVRPDKPSGAAALPHPQLHSGKAGNRTREHVASRCLSATPSITSKQKHICTGIYTLEIECLYQKFMFEMSVGSWFIYIFGARLVRITLWTPTVYDSQYS
jgi:hypothetical protein